MPPAHRAPADMPPLYQLTHLLFRCYVCVGMVVYVSAMVYVCQLWCMCVSDGVGVGLVVAILVHMCAHTVSLSVYASSVCRCVCVYVPSRVYVHLRAIPRRLSRNL